MEFIKGNLLEADVEALVNTVNTVGVMGKGIALQFKEAFPNNFKEYARACKSGELQPGKLLVFKEMTLQGEKIIVNFPTKTEWYQKSKYEYIEDGLKALAVAIDTYNIKSIAIPPLGCGNGGLKWENVKPLIEKYLQHFVNVQILVYEPNEKVKELLKKQKIKREAKLTPARAILLYSMFYYETTGENSNLFIANKLAYFLQRLGERNFNKLEFKKSHYGPYSVGVEHMLYALNGRYLKGLEQRNARAFETLELQYEKVREVSDFVKKELTSEQRQRIKNLIDLINGFQSALALEVLATVDFVRKNNSDLDQDRIVSLIHEWSPRKQKLFQEKYILIAWKHLEEYSMKLDIK